MRSAMGEKSGGGADEDGVDGGVGCFGIPGFSFPGAEQSETSKRKTSKQQQQQQQHKSSTTSNRGTAKSSTGRSASTSSSSSSSSSCYPLFRPVAPQRKQSTPSSGTSSSTGGARSSSGKNGMPMRMMDDDIVDPSSSSSSSSSEEEEEEVSLASLARVRAQKKDGPASGRSKKKRKVEDNSSGSNRKQQKGQRHDQQQQRRQQRQLGIGAFLSSSVVSSSSTAAAAAAASSVPSSRSGSSSAGGSAGENADPNHHNEIDDEAHEENNDKDDDGDASSRRRKRRSAVSEAGASTAVGTALLQDVDLPPQQPMMAPADNTGNDDDDDIDDDDGASLLPSNRPARPTITCPRRRLNALRFGMRYYLCPPSVPACTDISEVERGGERGVIVDDNKSSSTSSSGNADDGTSTAVAANDNNGSAGSAADNAQTSRDDATPATPDIVAPDVNVLSELFRRASFPTRYGRGGSTRRTAMADVAAAASVPTATPSIRGPTQALRRYANSSKNWGPSGTVALDGRCIGGTVALEFDRQGVLLASADNGGIVRIFDFDEVSAADVAARRNVCRETASAAAAVAAVGVDSCIIRPMPLPTRPPRPVSINPMMEFSTRSTSTISSIKWNPYNEDQLAVSFLTDSRVRVYDLVGRGSEAQGPKFLVLSEADSLRGPLRGEGTTSVLFLSPPNRKTSSVVTGGSYGTLRLWHAPAAFAVAGENTGQRRKNQRSRVPSMIWSICPFASSPSAQGEGISEIVFLDRLTDTGKKKENRAKMTGLLLVGGSKGSLVLIDKDKCTKKAFATKLTPTVLWSTNVARQVARRRLVDGARLPPISWMGIKKISLWGDSAVKAANNSVAASAALPADEARFTVVANCGWAFSASICGLAGTSSLSAGALSISLSLAHRTAPIMYLNSSLEEVQIGESARAFSLPHCPTPACILPGHLSFLCIADVKRIVKIMPDKDKRVLSRSEPALSNIDDISKNDDDAVLLVDLDCSPSEKQQTQGRPHNVVARIVVGDDSPQCIAAHPSSECIIVGFGSGREDMVLLCQRSKSEQ